MSDVDLTRIRSAARRMMLHARAEHGVVTVPESDAIELLHALEDVAQVPNWDHERAICTWTTTEAE
jgi:hypothetical protein